jgi:hypothetical protein
MTERTQINFRIENTLLAAIRDRCEAEDITQTDFITNALKMALGMPRNLTAYPTQDALERLASRLAEIEQYQTKLDKQLDERIEAAIQRQMAEVMGEPIA